MNKKLPPEAFAFYAGLGPGRSYEALAQHFGVNKRTVVTRAKQENWQARVKEMERKARERAEQKATESIEEMNDRHLRTAQFLQRKALDALQRIPIEEAVDAVRALKLGIEHERLIRGEPSERMAVTLEETIRSEYQRWMQSDGQDEDNRELDQEPEHVGNPDPPAQPDAQSPEPAAGEDAA